MNGAAVRVVLQSQNARAACSVRIIFYGDRRSYSCDRFARQNTILGKLIKAVVLDEIVAAQHER